MPAIRRRMRMLCTVAATPRLAVSPTTSGRGSSRCSNIRHPLARDVVQPPSQRRKAAGGMLLDGAFGATEGVCSVSLGEIRDEAEDDHLSLPTRKLAQRSLEIDPHAGVLGCVPLMRHRFRCNAMLPAPTADDQVGGNSGNPCGRSRESLYAPPVNESPSERFLRDVLRCFPVAQESIGNPVCETVETLEVLVVAMHVVATLLPNAQAPGFV